MNGEYEAESVEPDEKGVESVETDEKGEFIYKVSCKYLNSFLGSLRSAPALLMDKRHSSAAETC